MIVDDLFKQVDENTDELQAYLKQQFPKLRQTTPAQRDAERDQQLADRAARAQAHKDALKNAPPKEPTKTMSHDDSVVAFNDKMRAKGGRFTNMGDSVEPKHNMVSEAGEGNASLQVGINPNTNQPYDINQLGARRPRFDPWGTRAEPAAVAPAGQTPEEIRKAKQAAAAALAQQQMNTPTAPTVAPTQPAQQPAPAIARVGAPAGKQAVDQAVATVKSVRSDRRPQVINYGKQQFDTLAQKPAVTPAVTQKPIPQYTTNLPATATATPNNPLSRAPKDYIKSIGAPALPESQIAQTLKKSVTEMLAMVESKEDVKRIKQFVDQTFARHSTVTESSFAERNQLIKLIKEHSHKMAR